MASPSNMANGGSAAKLCIPSPASRMRAASVSGLGASWLGAQGHKGVTAAAETLPIVHFLVDKIGGLGDREGRQINPRPTAGRQPCSSGYKLPTRSDNGNGRNRRHFIRLQAIHIHHIANPIAHKREENAGSRPCLSRNHRLYGDPCPPRPRLILKQYIHRAKLVKRLRC